MTLATTTPVTPELLRGCLDTEITAEGLVPHRLPAWVRARGTDPQLAMVETENAGVRLAFRSRATDTGGPPVDNGRLVLAAVREELAGIVAQRIADRC